MGVVASLGDVARCIEARRRTIPPARSVLAGISGIDGSGKSYLAAGLARRLERAGYRVARLGVDGWLNVPAVRFSAEDPAGHFYHHAIRFDEMFRDAVLPLRDRRSIDHEAAFVEETATESRPHRYCFTDVDIVLLEGIYLFKRALRPRYDVSVWIDCRFETALDRAIARAQEGLPPAATATAYHTIYLPAQELHFRIDAPRDAADLIVDNDARAAASIMTGGVPLAPGPVVRGRPGAS